MCSLNRQEKPVNRGSKSIWNVCEPWAWLTVLIIWVLAFLFSATLVLSMFRNIIVYFFAGDDWNTSVVMLIGVAVLIGIVALSWIILETRERLSRRRSSH